MLEDTQQESNDLMLQIAYSYCFEKSMSKFLDRLDKLATFLLLLTSMSAFATLLSLQFFSIIVAVITVLQLVYSPAKYAQSAKDNSISYYNLYSDSKSLELPVLREKLKLLQAKDNNEIGMLSYPSRLSALCMRGMVPPEFDSESRKLTIMESLASRFAGEYPEYPFHTIEPKN